jgi:hypothetical protein
VPQLPRGAGLSLKCFWFLHLSAEGNLTMTAVPPCADVDADLTKRVRIFLINSRYELSGLDVVAHDGIVTLVGPVSTFYLRQLATACARRVAGVRKVIDGIEVCYDGDHASTRKPHAFSCNGCEQVGR